jgi:hypothetical protein
MSSIRLSNRAKVAAATAVGLALTVGAAAPYADSGGTSEPEVRAAGEGEARGRFSLIMMVHTNASAGNFNVPTQPWNGDLRDGALFNYRSIACTGNAPVNNISSDLPSYNTKVPGSRVPSSMRAHPLTFRLRRTNGRWTMRGQIDFTVCQLRSGPTPRDETVADRDKPKIRVRYTARFARSTPEAIRWHGRFRIVGGTQRYDDLRGSGDIAGYFFCFQPGSCTESGEYADGQFVMHGSYRDPTPQLGG